MRVVNSLRTMLATSLAAASLFVAAGLAAPVPVAACSEPILSIIIDLEASEPLAPAMTLRAEGLALPATGRFNWGNGQFGVANITMPGGTNAARVQINPVYSEPGAYSLTISLADSCGGNWTETYSFTAPLVLPSPVSIECPGDIDADGVCVVPTDEELELAVSGGPADATWTWTGAVSASDSATLTVNDGLLRQVQARSTTPDGTIVTPLLAIVGRAPAKPVISDFVTYSTLPAGEPANFGFEIPAGAEEAAPAILLDGQPVAEAASVEMTLTPGGHRITYLLIWPDGSRIQREVAVVALETAAVSPQLALIGVSVGIGVLLVLIIALLLAHRSSRRSGPPS